MYLEEGLYSGLARSPFILSWSWLSLEVVQLTAWHFARMPQLFTWLSKQDEKLIIEHYLKVVSPVSESVNILSHLFSINVFTFCAIKSRLHSICEQGSKHRQHHCSHKDPNYTEQASEGGLRGFIAVSNKVKEFNSAVHELHAQSFGK